MTFHHNPDFLERFLDFHLDRCEYLAAVYDHTLDSDDLDALYVQEERLWVMEELFGPITNQAKKTSRKGED